ncbi:MAG: hypothetical protein LUE17_02345 [Planctomycetaceae bacterium]|nr:hypothetical protein [Planctomycetaceae bacterium]
MHFKRTRHYPQQFPTYAMVRSLAHGLAYDAGDIPRRHERWFFLITDVYMERPVGQVSQKH